MWRGRGWREGDGWETIPCTHVCIICQKNWVAKSTPVAQFVNQGDVPLYFHLFSGVEIVWGPLQLSFIGFSFSLSDGLTNFMVRRQNSWMIVMRGSSSPSSRPPSSPITAAGSGYGYKREVEKMSVAGMIVCRLRENLRRARYFFINVWWGWVGGVGSIWSDTHIWGWSSWYDWEQDIFHQCLMGVGGSSQE